MIGKNIKAVIFSSALLLSFLFIAPYKITFAQDHLQAAKDITEIDEFYLKREGEPFWLKGRRLNKQGKNLLMALHESWQHGFNPENYDVEFIQNLKDKLSDDKSVAAELEVLLTKNYIHLAQDLSGMRINPKEISMDAYGWRMQVSVRNVLDKLQNEDDVAKALKFYEPQGQTYQKIKAELVRLVTENNKNIEHDQITIQGTLKPGDRDAIVPELRKRFTQAVKNNEDSDYYDADLVEIIKQFQSENGLRADGIIGKQTLASLNLNNQTKIERLITNLERLRWLPENTQGKRIIVNIPSATLWAVEDGIVKLEMPVIVGREKRKTEVFISKVTGVRFNPTWTVPPTIKAKDIVPKMIKDPNYMTNKGMELYQNTQDGLITIDPMSVDWANISKAELNSYRMVQVAGANNPLGRIRILMPNKFDIYLHDTNEQGGFSRINRMESSGCVRLERPMDVALFVLSENKGFDAQKLNELIESNKTRDILIKDKFPVFLLYNTVWIDESGRVIYGRDLYFYDSQLFRIMKKNNMVFKY